jgi:hypothetical protein
MAPAPNGDRAQENDSTCQPAEVVCEEAADAVQVVVLEAPAPNLAAGSPGLRRALSSFGISAQQGSVAARPPPTADALVLPRVDSAVLEAVGMREHSHGLGGLPSGADPPGLDASLLADAARQGGETRQRNTADVIKSRKHAADSVRAV